jgi:hypothetical protein
MTRQTGSSQGNDDRSGAAKPQPPEEAQFFHLFDHRHHAEDEDNRFPILESKKLLGPEDKEVGQNGAKDGHDRAIDLLRNDQTVGENKNSESDPLPYGHLVSDIHRRLNRNCIALGSEPREKNKDNYYLIWNPPPDISWTSSALSHNRNLEGTRPFKQIGWQYRFQFTLVDKVSRNAYAIKTY